MNEHSDNSTLESNANDSIQPPKNEGVWQVFSSIEQLKSALSSAQFKSLFNTDCPFTSAEFLSALEKHDCIDSNVTIDENITQNYEKIDGLQTGWLAQYYLYQNSRVPKEIGLFICYIKHHSYGEYVFDWAWADAYHRHGLDYYPKLISAIPFTPVPTSKWLGSSKMTEAEAWQAVLSYAKETGVTGGHLLFPAASFEDNKDVTSSTIESNTKPLSQSGAQPENEYRQPDAFELIERHGHQFHWFNKKLGSSNRYASFDDFLNDLTARKRKMIKKERKRVADAGIRCVWKSGDEVPHSERVRFYQYYHNTYFKRGRQGYLTFGFFNEIFETLASKVRLLVCYHGDEMVASALYFIQEQGDKTVLCGRYWGSNEGFDLVHFEACYYSGIEYAINKQIDIFNPGTQGEHKIPRGFRPIVTHSYHHLFQSPFHDAINDYCRQEQVHNQLYIKECETRLPFKATDP